MTKSSKASILIVNRIARTVHVDICYFFLLSLSLLFWFWFQGGGGGEKNVSNLSNMNAHLLKYYGHRNYFELFKILFSWFTLTTVVTMSR